MAAGIGQLRGLRALGLLDGVRYISAVSGGTWVSAPFLFSPLDEATLLGPVAAPETLTLDNLAVLPTQALGHLATRSLRNTLFHLLGDVPEDRLWVDAVGEDFLRPIGLYDPSNVANLAQDAAQLADIRARNPGFATLPFHLPRANRPFLICNGCIIGPRALAPLERESPISLEMTPMYCGSPRRLDVTFFDRKGKASQRVVGGGYVETFAFGGPSPKTAAAGPNPIPLPRYA